MRVVRDTAVKVRLGTLVQIAVKGLTAATAPGATSALLATPGVYNAAANAAGGTVTVTLATHDATPAQALQALQDKGFDAEIAERQDGGQGSVKIARFRVEGMVCGSCSAAVTSQLLSKVRTAAVGAHAVCHETLLSSGGALLRHVSTVPRL
jgi:copper chaperone CopZ